MHNDIPIHDELLGKGITIARSLPDSLPDKTSVVSGTQYVVINADSKVIAYASWVNPIPYLSVASGFIVEQWEKLHANKLKDHITQVDPYLIAIERMAESPILSKRADALKLIPFVYMMESEDQKYRLSLVFRIDGEDWVGRYMYHLPTMYTFDEMKSDNQKSIETLRREITEGCERLRNILEKDVRGEWKTKDSKAEIGSYFLAGTSPYSDIFGDKTIYKDVDILEDGKDYLIIRAKGDLDAPGNDGALIFGVHYFRKDQLYTFTKK